MSALIALPNETLLEIIEDICPDDLPSFALSCKHTLSLSQECLNQHCKREKKYSAVRFYGCPGHGDDGDPSILLRDILNDWRIAFYPRSMTIECRDCLRPLFAYNEHKEALDENDENSEEEDDTAENEDADGTHDTDGVEHVEYSEQLDRVIKDFAAAIMKKIRQTGCPRSEAFQVKTRGIGRRGAILGLLLTRLPNLESLTLGQYTWGASTFQTILWNIVESNLDPNHAGAILLPKLRMVNVVGSNPRAFEDAELFDCFALLPSMKLLSGRYVHSSIQIREDDMYYRDDRTSTVAEIDFQNSEICSRSFDRLLSGITRLRKFTYGSGGALNGIHPYRLIDLLLFHSRTTLEYLKLKSFPWQKLQTYDGASGGSLRDFDVLKDICLFSALWVEHESSYEAATGKKLPAGDRTTMPLVKVLPSSIETVQLEGLVSMREVDHLLTGIIGPKGRRLRSLRRVVFRDVESSSDSFEKWARAWKECCVDMGVSLEFGCAS